MALRDAFAVLFQGSDAQLGIGERVRLRGLERDDIPAFMRWFNDPEVRATLEAFSPLSRAQEERWFEAQLVADDQYVFAIEAAVEGAWLHIGSVGLHRIDWKSRVTTLGLMLGDKSQWGRGFGPEATRVAVRFAFHELGLNRVELDVYEFNRRGIRCYEKVGFQHEGIRRQAFFRDGRFWDVHRMGVLRAEFDAR